MKIKSQILVWKNFQNLHTSTTIQSDKKKNPNQLRLTPLLAVSWKPLEFKRFDSKFSNFIKETTKFVLLLPREITKYLLSYSQPPLWCTLSFYMAVPKVSVLRHFLVRFSQKKTWCRKYFLFKDQVVWNYDFFQISGLEFGP